MLLVAPLDIYTPKAHLMYRLILRCVQQGNPWSYHTFYVEGLNKLLKKTFRLCHQGTFEYMAMAKLSELLCRTGRQRLA